jgi:hypothetical protein
MSVQSLPRLIHINYLRALSTQDDSTEQTAPIGEEVAASVRVINFRLTDITSLLLDTTLSS